MSGDQRRTLRVPFLNHEHATVARRALEVDKEQHPHLVERKIEVEESVLVVDFAAATVRLLRLATNTFLSSVDLVVRTMEEFAPDPSKPPLTDAQLEEQRRVANEAGGAVKGIELRGDGRGAGSGEEVL